MDHNYTRHTTSREQEKPGMLSSPLPFALAMLGAGAVIFCLWYFFYSGNHGPSDQAIPIIKAEAGPMKVKPDSASQPEVPHQDKLVYGRVNPAEQGAGVERLLPPTEEPMETAENDAIPAPTLDSGFPSPKASAENKSEFRTEPSENKLETAAIVEPVAEPSPAVVAKETTVSVDQVAGVKTAEVKEAVSEKPAEAVPAVEAKPAPAQNKTLQSGYRIQLASMKSKDLAKQEWQRLQGEHKNALESLSANFARVDLGAKKGIFYRVQAGDFVSKADAQNVCNKLKSQNQNVGCFIVKF